MDLTGVDLTTETVRTERLVLRPFRPADVDAVFRASQDPDIPRWISASPCPTRARTPASSSRRSPRCPTGPRAPGLLSAVEADGEFVGSAGCLPDRRAARPRARLLPRALGARARLRRRGRAARWRPGPSRLGALRVAPLADVRNAASQAVARRAGFSPEGIVRSCLHYRDGTRGDAVLFGRIAGE